MLELLKVGHCFHPEAIVTSKATLKIAKFSALVGLIKLPDDGYMLFDTGYSERFNEVTETFPNRLYRIVTPITMEPNGTLPEQLAQRHIAIDDIKVIFLSHFHADHIAALKDFPNAKIICSKSALDSMEKLQGFRGLIKGYLPELLPDDIATRVSFIEDTQTSMLDMAYRPFQFCYDLFGDGHFLAVELPGHAYGHFGLLMPKLDKVPFLVADACWTEDAYVEGCPPTKITHMILPNARQYLETIYKLAQLFYSDTEVTLIPSHCEKAFKRWKSDVEEKV